MKLKYTDENDRCYGATGMAIGVTVCDSEGVISSISLDAPAGEMIEFTSDYYFSGNPRLSAKVAWNHILRHYDVSMNMLLSNLLCRTCVAAGKAPDAETRRALLAAVEEEGRETCSLENDEIERMFNRNYDYLYRVFNHSGVKHLAHDFATHLREHRTMTRAEILEALSALRVM